jgi:hypothetical protein
MTTFCVYKDDKLIEGPMASDAGAWLECIAANADWVVERELDGTEVQKWNRNQCLEKLRRALRSIPSPG